MKYGQPQILLGISIFCPDSVSNPYSYSQLPQFSHQVSISNKSDKTELLFPFKYQYHSQYMAPSSPQSMKEKVLKLFLTFFPFSSLTSNLLANLCVITQNKICISTFLSTLPATLLIQTTIIFPRITEQLPTNFPSSSHHAVVHPLWSRLLIFQKIRSVSFMLDSSDRLLWLFI